MPRGPYYLSPHCVLLPGPDHRSFTVIQSEYGSHFVLESRLLRTLLGQEDDFPARPPNMSLPEWTAVRQMLLRERVLIDGRAYRRILKGEPFKNRLDPLEVAVLRGVNEGGMKRRLDGPSPPAAKPAVARRRVYALATHAPDDGVKGLATCLQRRQSVRAYSLEPMRRRQLEQFLQLTARADGNFEHPTVHRPYPSGGARYPLEIYPVLLNVESFSAGIYHYQPFTHRLELVSRKKQYVDALARDARHRMARANSDPGDSSVLFLITAVTARTCWKYTGIPLLLILQETGALYQTMYLTATAMALAPCAVGAFPLRAVGEMLGLDPAEEVQVGLFALGVPLTSR